MRMHIWQCKTQELPGPKAGPGPRPGKTSTKNFLAPRQKS